MTQHTPGPWVITTGADDDTVITSTRDADGLDDDVAMVYGGNDGDPSVREANARLIAAAPDLLAQAKLWHDESHIDGCGCAMSAAIAKATGEGVSA